MGMVSNVMRHITGLRAYITCLRPPMHHYERGCLSYKGLATVSSTPLRAAECRSIQVDRSDIHIHICHAICWSSLSPVCLRYSLYSQQEQPTSFASIRPPGTDNE